MVPRRYLAVLVGALAFLLVAFAVLMAFHLLVHTLGDSQAARALLWTAVGCLVLLIIDLLLLVIALAVNSLRDDESLPGE